MTRALRIKIYQGIYYDGQELYADIFFRYDGFDVFFGNLRMSDNGTLFVLWRAPHCRLLFAENSSAPAALAVRIDLAVGKSSAAQLRSAFGVIPRRSRDCT